MFLCLAASVLWLPYQAYSLLVRSAAQSSSPLAETSELFLLLLAFHAPVQGDAGANPYLQALRRLQVMFFSRSQGLSCKVAKAKVQPMARALAMQPLARQYLCRVRVESLPARAVA